MTNIARLGGLGFSEESKTVNSAAVKPKHINLEEEENVLDEAVRMKFRSLVATLNQPGPIRCAVRCGGYMQKDVESDTRELEEAEEGSRISERSGKSDLGDAGMETRRDEG